MALVVFLRGVNVGGHRTFRPSVLAERLAVLDVVNIGAAGTLVVRASVTQARLRAELALRLPFTTEIALCQGRDILRLVSRDPFAGQPSRASTVRFVSVLTRTPRTAPAVPLAVPSAGQWQLKLLGREGRFVYGIYRRHMKAIGHLGGLDRLFGIPVTTRSWTTITAIAAVLRVTKA